MPRTLWNENDRRELLARVDHLRPDMHPTWGKMNAVQMMTHLTDWMRLATGELKTEPKLKPMRYPVIKHLVVYVMPWPKGVPTAPELLERQTDDWGKERAEFSRRLASFEKPESGSQWPVHPAFGRLSTNAWGVLGYRHTDHHLRQFGV
jgi:hypothetical protein